MTGLWILLGALTAGLAVGVALRLHEGRIRPARPGEDVDPSHLPERVADALGPAVTLVQISTTFCSPCRHTHARLAMLAENHDGLRHADIDVTHEPEIAHQLGVLRTPTTIAYDAAGTELLRVGGVPDADALLDSLRPHLAPA
ncbi:thioredoxin family protein [Haloechinothrix salitolerans]|uniref:Thioredoxin family protein n=1 Tax=Haloechinothrix salitolerans TaxID=926830 RepID=A0ABW2BSA7_9PSEU